MAGMTDSPELLTVSDAATLAGVSARTMRRWAASGQVRTVGRGHGRRVAAASLLDLPATEGQTGQEQRSHDDTVAATSDTETASGHEAGHLAALVRALTERLAEQTGLTAMWQERARMLSDQLALEAPKSPPDASTAPQTVEPPTDTPTPLWRWLALVLVVAVTTMVVLLAWPR